MFLDDVIRKFRFGPIWSLLPRQPGTLLDIGCGCSPWFAQPASPLVSATQIWGIDKEPAAAVSVKYIHQRYLIEKTLSWENDFFGCVTMLAVLEHLNYPREILREIHRILRPGGVLVLTTPTWLAKPILEFLAFRLGWIDTGSIRDHKRYFSKQELRELLEQCGFKVRRAAYFEAGCNLIIQAEK